MKYFMILVTALMLIGAGGAGGYFFFEQSAVASAGKVSKDALASKKAKEYAVAKAKEEIESLRFVEMDPIILPIIDGRGVTQVVTLVITLEAYGDENAKLAEKMIPRLKDAYLQDMYGVLSRKASMKGGLVKTEDLKERLNKISNKVLGEDKINGVLLQVVSQRPVQLIEG